MKEFMLRAIKIAKSGKGWTNPNPLVGAVIVREGKIIAEGYHHKCGDLHAERDALKNARENNIDVSGATMYVTLEPCCHTGRQPPCVEAIVEAGIKKVVIGSRDPNPLVNGGGVQFLKAHGIEVQQDFLREECDSLNAVFFHYIKTKKPYVIVKYAMTMDGETAASTGESKWITGEEARKNVHRTRSECMAVIMGIETVLKDNPMMNVRLEGNYRQPVRIVLDSALRIDLNSNIVKTASNSKCGKVIVFCSKNFDEEKAAKKAQLEKLKVEVKSVPVSKSGHIDLNSVLSELGKSGIDSVLVESGGRLNAGMFFEASVQEVHAYIAPKIFGNDGEKIYSPVRGIGVNFPSECIKFGKPEIEFFGSDILLKWRAI